MNLIPKSFKIAGLTIDVVTENNLVSDKHCIGEARYSKQQIAIDKSAAPSESTEQAFYHELIHWCFYILGEEDMRNNEKLVDMLAHLLYQFEKTKVFQDAPKKK